MRGDRAFWRVPRADCAEPPARGHPDRYAREGLPDGGRGGAGCVRVGTADRGPGIRPESAAGPHSPAIPRGPGQTQRVVRELPRGPVPLRAGGPGPRRDDPRPGNTRGVGARSQRGDDARPGRGDAPPADRARVCCQRATGRRSHHRDHQTHRRGPSGHEQRAQPSTKNLGDFLDRPVRAFACGSVRCARRSRVDARLLRRSGRSRSGAGRDARGSRVAPEQRFSLAWR